MAEQDPAAARGVIEAALMRRSVAAHRRLQGHLPGVRIAGKQQAGAERRAVGQRYRTRLGERREVQVPGHRRVRVKHADDLPELDGEVDLGLDLRAALGAVAVQQGLGRAPGQYEVELPGQVGRVPQARAQPLAGERRHLVGGVARHQQPPAPPSVDQAGAEGVQRVPLQDGVGRGQAPGFEQPPGGRRRIEAVLVLWQAHELEPAPPWPPGHRGGRPGRVADLDVQRRPAGRLGRADVDDQPLGLVVVVGDIQAR